MPGRPSNRAVRLIGTVMIIGSALVGTAGCAAELSPPTPNGRAAAQCRNLTRALPQVVDQQKRRDVEPRSDFTSGWGRPAITLACGVDKPAGMHEASKCWEVNGVGWYAEERDADIRYTTIGRSTLVQVTVPNKYTPQANALVDLAPAVKSQIPLDQPCV